MKYGSVCSGIEAATVAWHPLGWKPQAFSEIEPLPCSVLAHHYPNVPNHGDMTKFKEWPDAVLNVLVGGTPCQSFSVAGLRKGLDDPRGNLMLTYIAIAHRYRPQWVVWENVPGVLSSNGGRDFACLLRGLEECGYGVAYRVLDAQYFGVAQRRRRVFVVGCLGSWQRAAAVLFEQHSLCGNTPPSREKGQGVAAAVGFSAGNSSGSRGVGYTEEGTPPLRAGMSGTNQVPTIAYSPSSFGQYQEGIGTLRKEGGDLRGGSEGIICYPLNTQIITRGEALGEGTGFGLGEDGDPQYTLQAAHHHAIAVRTANTSANGHRVSDDLAHTLDQAQGQAVATHMQVRRLLPIECERLQGFPDNYTLVPHRGKPAADGPRYKALGNSMAVPCMRWIGERIQMVEDLPCN